MSRFFKRKKEEPGGPEYSWTDLPPHEKTDFLSAIQLLDVLRDPESNLSPQDLSEEEQQLLNKWADPLNDFEKFREKKEQVLEVQLVKTISSDPQRRWTTEELAEQTSQPADFIHAILLNLAKKNLITYKKKRKWQAKEPESPSLKQ